MSAFAASAMSATDYVLDLSKPAYPEVINFTANGNAQVWSDTYNENEYILEFSPYMFSHLRRGMAGRRPHDPCDYLTKCTRVDPGDTGRAMWQDALRDVFCGDEALIAYAQRIAGLSLIGKVYVEAVIIAYGGGRNGKSTYWNAQAKVLGTYAGTISADALTARCPRNVKPEMAELKGRRLVIASETEEGMRFSTSVIKQLASTDPVAAEKKYKDPFHFEPTHTLVLYTNHLPRVGAMDEGIWRRLIVIPFGAVFEGEKDIRNYGAELAEKAGPAILAWMIRSRRSSRKATWRKEKSSARAWCKSSAIPKISRYFSYRC